MFIYWIWVASTTSHASADLNEKKSKGSSFPYID
nr:MAG TPA: hypothetical protein [Caudoviricetes sp.]